MDIKQLEAFFYVAEEGTFSGAAKKMGLSQPTVSAHIAGLEDELGSRLFDRTPGEAITTETGRVLYPYARQILQLRSEALAGCKAIRNSTTNTIRIAASTIPYQYILPIITSEFHLRHPVAQFRVSGSDSQGVSELILGDTADVGFTGTIIESKELIYEPFMEDGLVVVTPRTEPYLSLSDGRIGLDVLRSAPLVLREPGSGTRLETEAYLQKLGLNTHELDVVANMDNPDAIIKAVSQGLGISVVSNLLAQSYERSGQICMFYLEGIPISRTIYIVRHKSRELPGIANMFVDFIRRKMIG